MTFEPLAHQDIPEGFLLLELNGRNMTTLERMYQEFTSVFQFPDYFGKNLNALDECLTDLEWLPAEGYLVIVKNAEFLLKNESDEVLQGLLSTLNDAGREWAVSVNQGEAWDRDSLPFHTVLELDENVSSDFINRLAQSEIPQIKVLRGAAGRGDAHGGPHWDIQTPGGGYVNIYPGGSRR